MRIVRQEINYEVLSVSEYDRKIYEREKFPHFEETLYPNSIYAISAEWMRGWQEYVGYQRARPSNMLLPPGEILNINLKNALD